MLSLGPAQGLGSQNPGVGCAYRPMAGWPIDLTSDLRSHKDVKATSALGTKFRRAHVPVEGGVRVKADKGC